MLKTNETIGFSYDIKDELYNHYLMWNNLICDMEHNAITEIIRCVLKVLSSHSFCFTEQSLFYQLICHLPST